MADMKIRDFLTGRGNKDSDITYNNGNVYLKGKQFYGATPQSDGSTYADQNQLSQAYNNYDVRDLTDQVKSRLTQPRQAYGGYDANSDPAYQAAKAVAQRSANTAGNNASVRLGARGIGNSQQALTTENQIQQGYMADVNDKLLPQLMTQHYNRYMDQQNLDRQGTQDLLGLAGTYNNLGQQGFNNDRLIAADAESKKKSNLDAARLVGNDLGRVITPKDDWSNLYNQDDAPLNFDGQKYKDDIAQRAVENQLKTGAQAIQQQNANRLSAGGGSKGGASGSSSVKNMSSAQFNDIADTLQKKYGVVEYKKDNNDDVITDANGNPTISYTNTNNPDQKSKIVLEILNAELSDDDTLKLLNKMGITEAEARELLGG